MPVVSPTQHVMLDLIADLRRASLRIEALDLDILAVDSDAESVLAELKPVVDRAASALQRVPACLAEFAADRDCCRTFRRVRRDLEAPVEVVG